MFNAAPTLPPSNVAAPNNPNSWSWMVLSAAKVTMKELLKFANDATGAIIELVNGVPLIKTRELTSRPAVKLIW